MNAVRRGVLIEEALAVAEYAEQIEHPDDLVPWIEWGRARARLNKSIDGFGPRVSAFAANEALYGRPGRFIAELEGTVPPPRTRLRAARATNGIGT